MERSHIFILTIGLSIIFILIATALYFIANAQNPSFPWSGMMGEGASATSGLSSAWIISAGLIGAAAVVGVGLIVYFLLPKNGTATQTRQTTNGQHVLKVPTTTHDGIVQRYDTEEQKLTKPMMRKIKGRVATGIGGLDELLYGGLPPNFAVALTSPSCDERHSLVKSFLETGAKSGEVTFYLTINPNSARVLAEEYTSNFYLFVCNPQAEALIKKVPNVIILQGIDNLTDISIAMTQAIRKLTPSTTAHRRICIDLVSDVLLRHHSVLTRRWLTELVTELNSAEFTTLAVVEPQMHSPTDLHAILSIFDGEINVLERETATGSARFLQIRRMSNEKYLKDEILLQEN